MSRKKIVAATMIAAALGLAFAGYTATRANGMEEMPRPARPLPPKADAGYRQNHQIGHDGAVFEWMDAASLNKPSHLLARGEEPGGKDLISDEELEPVAIQHAYRTGTSGWEGFGFASGGGGGTPKGTDDAGGGRYARNFGGFGFGGSAFIGGGGGGGGGSKGTSGSNDTAGDKPHDAPATSNDGTGDKPGTADPKADEPPATGPSNQDPPANPNPPPAEEQHQIPPTDDTHTPGGPNEDHPGNGKPPGDGDHPGNNTPPDNVHSVPEPATLGMLGFGLMAAAALRRRRRN